MPPPPGPGSPLGINDNEVSLRKAWVDPGLPPFILGAMRPTIYIHKRMISFKKTTQLFIIARHKKATGDQEGCARAPRRTGRRCADMARQTR